jgi:hypothetical protein
MKNVLRLMVAVTAGILLVASASIPSDAVAAKAARPSVFDGNWSVVIYTLQGDCEQSVRAALRIVGGRVYSEDQSYEVSGVVDPAGVIRVTVASGDQSASGSGRLSRNSGGGRWRMAAGNCSGQWTATRRVADY